MMTSPSQNLNIKGRHGGFDVRAGGDEKQKINFAWPNREKMGSSSGGSGGAVAVCLGSGADGTGFESENCWRHAKY